MIRPNWFDKKYSTTLESASVSEVLAEVAKDERVVKAVEKALAAHDAQIKANIYGPSRSQVVRRAIAEVLQSDDEGVDQSLLCIVPLRSTISSSLIASRGQGSSQPPGRD
jgi:hypothetical protein